MRNLQPGSDRERSDEDNEEEDLFHGIGFFFRDFAAPTRAQPTLCYGLSVDYIGTRMKN